TLVTANHDFDPAEAAAALRHTLGHIRDPSHPDVDRWTAGVDWFIADRRLDADTAPLVRHSLTRVYGGLNVGADPARISLVGAAAYTDGSGNALPIGGYSGLITELARGVDVRLGEEVTTIEWDAGHATITTATGVYRAARVVVSVPLALLQA